MESYALSNISLGELIKKIEQQNSKQFSKNATINVELESELNMWSVCVFDGVYTATIYMVMDWFNGLMPEPYNMQLGQVYIYNCNNPTTSISWQYIEYEVEKPVDPKPQGTMRLYSDFDDE